MVDTIEYFVADINQGWMLVKSLWSNIWAVKLFRLWNFFLQEIAKEQQQAEEEVKYVNESKNRQK